MTQSPAQPVGSRSSSARRHVGRNSSEEATHTSDGEQESQKRTAGWRKRGVKKLQQVTQPPHHNQFTNGCELKVCQHFREVKTQRGVVIVPTSVISASD